MHMCFNLYVSLYMQKEIYTKMHKCLPAHACTHMHIAVCEDEREGQPGICSKNTLEID